MKIKKYREAAGLTQEQLSKLFNPVIPVDTIKKWDSGQRNPPSWAEGMIIEKINMYNKGVVSAILTQEDVSRIMMALVIAKMKAEADIKSAKSQKEKELRESAAKKWGNTQREIGVKLGYYEEQNPAPKESTEDLMMALLRETEGR